MKFTDGKCWLTLIISVICVLASAEPKPTLKSRIVDRPLSDELHFEGSDHNPEFDHDAFLGKEEAKSFDDMTPEESQKRLGLLFVRIDTDGDGRVSPDELRDWMKNVQRDYVVTDTEKQWTDIKPRDERFITWEEYVNHTYGSEKACSPVVQTLRKLCQYLATRVDGSWQTQIMNDLVLSKTEFTNFLHPEEAEHMKDSVVQETLDEVDKDNDGFISLEEYMDDVGDEDEETGENWSKEDEDEFHSDLDKNGDGRLDHDEIYSWIVPSDYDHIDEETKHLFEEADVNKDGYLSGQEVVDNYEIFVGSQATDYGNALRHQEL